MHKLFYISFFLFACVSLFAQKADSSQQDKTVDSLELPTGKFDSLSSGAFHKADSINQKIRKLQSLKLQVPGAGKADSLKQGVTSFLNKPAELNKKLSHQLDSVNPQQRINQYNKKISILEKHLKHHIDSVSKLNLKDPKLTKSTDSLRHKLDSLKNSGPIKDINKAEQQLAKLQSGMNSKLKGLEGKVSQELSFNELGNVKIPDTPNLNVPNINVPNLNLPNTNLPGNVSLPNTNIGLNTSVPNTSLPSTGNVNLPSGSLPGTAQPSIPGSVNTPSLNNLLPSNEISTIEKQASQLSSATSEINKVEGGMKNLNPNALEKDVENTGELKKLSGEAAQVDQYKKMVAKWESDPAYRKEMMVTQAKEQAINHFAGQEKQLMAAMQQLSNVKKKYKDYEGALDMFKKPGNAMKGKPFIERLRPGFNLQFQGKRETLIDFNPQIGYRISGKITGGIGWNERWGYDFNKWNYVSQDHIYGPRAYFQYKVKSGIYALTTPEVMNALVPPSYNSTDVSTRKWVWTWMAGMKKEFRYAKNTLGNLQIMYNLLDKNHQSPYVSKLNIRMGIEFSMRKQK